MELTLTTPRDASPRHWVDEETGERVGAVRCACGREMDHTECRFTHVVIDGEEYERIPLGEAYEEETGCECLTPFGGIHHLMCDHERCPRCGGQFLGCLTNDGECKVERLSGREEPPALDEDLWERLNSIRLEAAYLSEEREMPEELRDLLQSIKVELGEWVL